MAGESCVVRSCILVLFVNYYFGDQIKDDIIGGTCSDYWREEICIQSFSPKSENKRTYGRFRPVRRWDDKYLRVRNGFVWPGLGISGALLWRL
jgi:hypothetical protein